MDSVITFIGAGNMARCIIGGLVQKGTPANNIRVSAPSDKHLDPLKQAFNIVTHHDNHSAVKDADVIVLAVKPQKMREVCIDLAGRLDDKALIISVAAGVLCENLDSWLGGNRAIVRCMPNTPSLVGMGASGLFANGNVSAEQKSLAEHLMQAVGLVQWVDQEAQIDAVTAVSGSGPAYFFLMLEAMTEAGQQLGLNSETARTLAIQTARGAALLAQESEQNLSQLRLNVTSPGGTTERAIASFEQNNFRQIVAQAMSDCAQRAAELAEQLGKSE